MEIGNRENLSIVDIYSDIYKYGITYLLIIIAIIISIVYIVLNKTSITEKLVIYKIALFNGYKIEYDADYTILTNDNINIILKYDEKESLSDKLKHKTDNNEHVEKLQNQSNVIYNLDNMLNPIRSKRLGLPDIGTYYLSFIGKDNIIYKSDIDVYDKLTAYKILNTVPENIAYLDVSVEPGATIEDQVDKWMKTTDLKRHRVNWNKIPISTRSISNKNLEVTHEYSVHTEIVFIDEDRGVIYATCKNDNSTISKLNKVLSELKVVAFLQKTALV